MQKKRTKLLAIGGVPATGKTSLMKKFISTTGEWRASKLLPLVDAIYNRDKDGYILGKYFPYYEISGYAQGTDKLSMGVQPKVVKYLKVVQGVKCIFEGDRLFTTSFLQSTKDTGVDVLAIILDVDKDLLHERHESRGDNQTEKFLKSRETKYNNIYEAGKDGLGVLRLPNNTEVDQEKILHIMKEWLNADN